MLRHAYKCYELKWEHKILTDVGLFFRVFRHEPFSVRSGNFVYIRVIQFKLTQDIVHDISISFKLN